ncbi:hypothetical protein Tco_0595523 [Tanacetum coccineum]
MYPSHLVLIDSLKNIALKRQQYVGEFIEGGRTRQPTGRVNGQTGEPNDQGVEANEGVNGVPDFSTIIAQQMQNLLPTILAQVSCQSSNQGNCRNQNGDAVNDNIQGDICGMVAATKPERIQKVGTLIDKAIWNRLLKKNINKRGNGGEPSMDRNVRDDNKRTRTMNAFATTANPLRREYTGTTPKCRNVTPDPLQQLGRNVTPDPYVTYAPKSLPAGTYT